MDWPNVYGLDRSTNHEFYRHIALRGKFAPEAVTFALRVSTSNTNERAIFDRRCGSCVWDMGQGITQYRHVPANHAREQDGSGDSDK